MADSHSSGDYSDVVSRRKFVSLAGTTGAAAVAGCIGGDGDGDDGDGDGDSGSGSGSGSDGDGDGDGDGDDSGSDETFDYGHEDIWFETAGGAFEVNTFHYNITTGWNIPHLQFGVFAAWTKYINGVDEFTPHLVTEWEHTDDNSFVLTLSEEFTWGESGDSITADDLAMQLRIQQNAGDALWDFIDDVEATGDYELTVNYPDGTRPDFITYSTLDRMAAFPPSIWEDEVDNDSPSEVSVDVPDPSGPLAVTATESNYHQAEPRNGLDDYEDDAVAGDHYNWNGYRLGYRQDNNAFHQSFIAGEVDGVHSLFASPDTLDQFPDSVRQFQIPGNFGMGVWPNHDSGPFTDRNVRQALYYSLDRNAIITNVGESTKIAHPTPTGLTAATINQYLGDVANNDGFTTYDLDQDQAESLLNEAGYDGFGDISTTLYYPASWSDWAVAAQSVVDQLGSVGWDIEGEGQSGGPGEYITDLTSGDFDLGVDQHTPGGDSSQNLPYFGLRYILRNDYYDTPEHFAGYTKNEVELGDTTVNIDETLSELSTATDDDARNELITQLARVVNQDVPVVYIMEKYEQSFINTERFDIPDDTDHFNAFWPLWWLPQLDESLESASDEATPGLLKANTN